MHCPRCNYRLTAEDKTCPRCHAVVDPGLLPSGANAAPAPLYGISPPPSPTLPLSQGYSGQLGGVRHLQGQLPVSRAATKARGVKARRWPLVLGIVAFFGLVIGAALLITAHTTSTGVAPVALRKGPSFAQVDRRMDGRLDNWTEAQQESYWEQVVGTQVTWSGEVVDVGLGSGGSIQLRCNPKTWRSDTHISLDGKQLGRLPAINKGQHITVRATLENHNTFGYTLAEGHVVKF